MMPRSSLLNTGGEVDILLGMNSVTKLLGALVVLLIILAAAWAVMTYVPTPTPTTVEQGTTDDTRLANVVTFDCAEGKSIIATFGQSEVGLVMSDGRSVTLSYASTDAESGAVQYSDGALSFWTYEFSAFVEEGGVETFSACRVGGNPAVE